mmetsp:Transcript_11923/g.22804  ORF Transcript_11923/g.22804 Transcript_11923/m.22804 type:complete len:108 (+) Transcript_11923:111-434(+)
MTLPLEDRLLQNNNNNNNKPSRPPSRHGNQALAGRLGLTSLLIVLVMLVLIAKLCFGHRGWAFRDDRTAPMVDTDDDDVDLDEDDLEKKRNDNDGEGGQESLSEEET